MVKDWALLVRETVNTLSRDVWAFLMLAAGVLLVLKGQKDVGVMVVGGALAVFKGENK